MEMRGTAVRLSNTKEKASVIADRMFGLKAATALVAATSSLPAGSWRSLSVCAMERQRHRHRNTETETQTQKYRDRDTDRHRDSEKDNETGS